jgi:MFS family permease
MFGMFFFLTQFLQEVLHYSPLKTGLAFLPFTVALFGTSQLSARRLVQRFGGKTMMLVGFTVSTTGMLLMTQLTASSSYISLLTPLVLFGAGNGLAFVPLTSTALSGVRPDEAGAASGLVNVMQQLGGALGLAVLVSVFGTAARGTAAQSLVAAQRAFVVGADHAFIAATLFVGATVVVLAVAVRGRRAAARTADAVAVPSWVRELEAPAIAVAEN